MAGQGPWTSRQGRDGRECAEDTKDGEPPSWGQGPGVVGGDKDRPQMDITQKGAPGPDMGRLREPGWLRRARS